MSISLELPFVCLFTAGKEMFGPSPVQSSLKDCLSSYRPGLQIYSPNRFVIKTVFLNHLFTENCSHKESQTASWLVDFSSQDVHTEIT